MHTTQQALSIHRAPPPRQTPLKERGGPCGRGAEGAGHHRWPGSSVGGAEGRTRRIKIIMFMQSILLHTLLGRLLSMKWSMLLLLKDVNEVTV